MHKEPDFQEIQSKWHGSLQAYLIGFGLSLLLTIAAFLFVIYQGDFPRTAVLFTVVGLALMQAIGQLIFFLHLGQESKPRWETLIFSFTVLVLLIIVSGTLWIMFDLNNRVMQM